MKSRIVLGIAVACVCAAVASPAHGRQTQAPPHAGHQAGGAGAPAKTADARHADMMAAMKAADQKHDALVRRMNAAKGPDKADAMAELLTALVDDCRTMHESMMSNMSTTNRMGQAPGRGGTARAPTK
jgi:cytochrome c556